MYRENDLLILIGAGCSVDAGIPASKNMIEKLEKLLDEDEEWVCYKKLYHLLRSSIHYSDGIQGSFKNNFDIERLVNVLSELEKKEGSILYPFIGSWSPRLLELAGYNFEIIGRFKSSIIKKLSRWVLLSDYRCANYFKGFFKLQNELDYSLRVFTLNYDLCFEKNIDDDKNLERGFDPGNNRWDWRRFEPNENDQPEIYLYKLHGSIDWERGTNGDIKCSDSVPEKPDIIFGTMYKMQYIDPYLFYAYEFRKYSLLSKVILTIGYSFRDEHINGIISQALNLDKDRKLLIVSPNSKEIINNLDYIGVFNDRRQIIPLEKRGREFLDHISLEEINDIIDNKNKPLEGK